MKNLIILLLLAIGINAAAQVAINTDGSAPDNSAMLDVKSTNKGLLVPRMTLAQRNLITNPATGLVVFQTNITPGLFYNSGTPAAPSWTLAGTSTGQWLTNGTSIYYNNGNVGIGTSDPTKPFVVKSSVLSDDMAMFLNGSDNYLFRIRQNSNGSGGLYLYDAANVCNVFLYGNGNSYIRGGRFGLGTNTPDAGLHLVGAGFPDSYMYIESSAGNDAGLRFYEGTTAKWHIFNDSDPGGLNIMNNAGITTLFADQSTRYIGIGTTAPASLLDVRGNLTVNNSGKLGIGTTSPVTLLDVHGNASITSGSLGIGTTSPSAGLHVKGTDFPNSFIFLESTSGNDAGIRFYEATTARWSLFHNAAADGLTLYNAAGKVAIFTDDVNAYVGINNLSPESELDVKGNIIVRDKNTNDVAVELGIGLDYAEGFNTSDMEVAEPGTVMSIDPEHPGLLTICNEEYDHKVAGIIAGANNLGSGITLGAGSHQISVALAGRVYCNADATREAISTGDLLTSSEMPGFAKKVSSGAKANGAILGKAMESLEKGQTGKILVLVTLQ